MKIAMQFFLVCISLIFLSCATSMSPAQVNTTLPSLTKYRIIPQTEAEKLVQDNQCQYLVKGRTYVAPMGLTTKEDLRYGARGIDEWVQLDGGNAFVLKNYQWVTVDGGGSQLHVEFDTFKCN